MRVIVKSDDGESIIYIDFYRCSFWKCYVALKQFLEYFNAFVELARSFGVFKCWFFNRWLAEVGTGMIWFSLFKTCFVRYHFVQNFEGFSDKYVNFWEYHLTVWKREICFWVFLRFCSTTALFTLKTWYRCTNSVRFPFQNYLRKQNGFLEILFQNNITLHWKTNNTFQCKVMLE